MVSLIKLTYLVNTPPPTQHYSFLKNLPHLFHSIIQNFWSVLFFSFIPFLFPFHFFFSFFSLLPSFTFPFFLWVTLLSYVRFFPRLNVPNKVFRNVWEHQRGTNLWNACTISKTAWKTKQMALESSWNFLCSHRVHFVSQTPSGNGKL